ncbi:MAG: OmpA family protein [Flavobacteriales bacterium]|nr:OmpA family protein [Flavobacteriales bacterium]
MRKLLISGICITLVLQSCVTARKYDEMATRKESADQLVLDLKAQDELCQTKLKETEANVEMLEKASQELLLDSTQRGKDYRYLRYQYDKVNELNDILMSKNALLLDNAKSENQKLLGDLNLTQEQLQNKEDALKALEKNLNEKETAVAEAQATLKDREAKLASLEQKLAEQEAASNALKAKISSALKNFEGKGLTVTQKDGKVYVSMEAKLLFASGSTKVEPVGVTAIKDLCTAIENEVDMEIIVEGHTDTDKLSSSTIPRDNWELSVLRATEVVKIMTSNSKIQPKILSASGRSEYHPLDPADKAKNRRIEIILQPKLDELYNLIEGE